MLMLSSKKRRVWHLPEMRKGYKYCRSLPDQRRLLRALACPWLIISEIFPTKVRGRAASIATSTLWSGTLLVTLTFLSLVKVLNLWGTFAIYGALSFACLLFVWKMVPETKGRTLEQIQQAWNQ